MELIAGCVELSKFDAKIHDNILLVPDTVAEFSVAVLGTTVVPYVIEIDGFVKITWWSLVSLVAVFQSMPTAHQLFVRHVDSTLF